MTDLCIDHRPSLVFAGLISDIAPAPYKLCDECTWLEHWMARVDRKMRLAVPYNHMRGIYRPGQP